MQGRPELDTPKNRPGLQRPLSDTFAEAIGLRQIIPNTLSDYPKKRMIVEIPGLRANRRQGGGGRRAGDSSKPFDPSDQLPQSSLTISGLSYKTAFKSEL